MRHKPRFLVAFLTAATLLLTPVAALADTAGATTPAPTGNAIAAVAAATKPAIVGILNTMKATESARRGQAAGTGFFYKPGVIVTNAHVVHNASALKILYSDKTVETVDPSKVSADDVSDIAVIRVARTTIAPPEFADSDQLQVGQQVIAIGNPLGFRLGSSVSTGILSGIGRAIGSGYPFLQTDAAINPGNSGGPLLDTSGKVIGINAAKEVNFGVEGLAFAIPSNLVRTMADRLLRDGKVERATLGISLQEDWQAYFGVPDAEGVTISDTISDGPAGLTTLRSGDKLVKLNDTPIYTADDYNAFMAQRVPGEQVTVTIKRQGQVLSVTLVCASVSDLRKVAEGANVAQPDQGILFNLNPSQIQEAASFGKRLSSGYGRLPREYGATSGNSYAVLYTEYLYLARRISSAYEFGFQPGVPFQQAVAAQMAGNIEVDMELMGDAQNFLNGATFTLTQEGYKATGAQQGNVNYASSPDNAVVIGDLAVRFPTAGMDRTKDVTVTVKLAGGKTYDFRFTIKDLR